MLQYVVFDISKEELENEPTREVKRLKLAASGGGCPAALAAPCGAVIGTGAACVACAEGAVSDLAEAKCSVELVEASCQASVGSRSPLTKALPPKLAPYVW